MRKLSREIDIFLYRHGTAAIVVMIIIITLATLAILRMAVQTMDFNAELAPEVKHLRVQQIIDGKKIAELDLERGERQMKKVGK